MLVPGPSVLLTLWYLPTSVCRSDLMASGGAKPYGVLGNLHRCDFRHHLVSKDPQLSQTCWYNGTQGM